MNRILEYKEIDQWLLYLLFILSGVPWARETKQINKQTL